MSDPGGRDAAGVRRGAGGSARRRVATALVLAVLAACLLLPSVAAGRRATGTIPARAAGHAATAGDEDRITLTAALFPWVPRLGQFQNVIAAAWQRRHSDVPLRFVLWDCYGSDPPAGLDVFVFDAIFLDRFVQRGLVSPIAPREIEDAEDLLPYALRAAQDDGGTLYGVPQLGCTSLLFYRRGDAALEAATDLGDVVRALGTRTYTGLRPPRHTGLLVDLSDPTADGCLYVDALEDTYGVYTAHPPLAETAGKLDPWAVGNVRDLLRMASRKEAAYASADQFRRARWFGRGLGRALVGYAENLSAMGEAGRASVALKLMPFSDRGDVPLFYADLAGVSPSVGTGKKHALALELANLTASTEVLVRALGPWQDDPAAKAPSPSPSGSAPAPDTGSRPWVPS